MKRKMRELLIAVMLVVMAAVLSITLISCGSSEKSDDDQANAKTQVETVMEDDSSEDGDDGQNKTAADKSGSKKSDSKSKDKSADSSKAEKPAKDAENDSGKTTGSTQPATQPTTKAPDVCYITIEGYCSGKAITLEGGDTVYSVLCRSGASVSGSGHYVKGINGKFEFDEGPTSGWTYYVNGSKPGVGCGSYSVKAGDNIKWDYVTSMKTAYARSADMKKKSLLAETATATPPAALKTMALADLMEMLRTRQIKRRPITQLTLATTSAFCSLEFW